VPGYDSAVTQGPRRGLLWGQLRESTHAAHAQAEASLAPLAQPDSLARYAALLCVLWGFQAPMERLLGHQELPSAVGWPVRQRLGALAADLTDLGVSVAPLREAAGLPALSSPGAVWGTLYVTEGATLGGRVLRRHIEARLGPVPLRFLDGHGNRTQPMWRDLGKLADQYVTTKHDRHLAQQTAMQAFAVFSTWCTDQPVATVRPGRGA
jgi:heme oxygenase (biliverdin-IX-beta and delta-forming)